MTGGGTGKASVKKQNHQEIKNEKTNKINPKSNSSDAIWSRGGGKGNKSQAMQLGSLRPSWGMEGGRRTILVKKGVGRKKE